MGGAVWVLFTATHAQAQFDTVRVDGGKASVSGNILSVSRDEIVVGKGAGGARKESVPVNRVYRVTFAGEPTELSRARVNVYNGAYENALEELNEIDTSSVDREEVQTDIEYYKVYSKAKLALLGEGDVRRASDELLSFFRKNSSSFHFYEGAELLGDLAVAAGDYATATKYFATLEKAEWADFQIRGKVLIGRALQKQDQHQAAVSKFEEALNIPSDAPEAESQKLAATLGKAVSLTEAGQVEQAVKMVEEVIKAADPENKDLHARAYNALGACHRKAGEVKPAVLAYLHVDLLYNSLPDEHAEALYYLNQLFNRQGQEDRAREALALLRDRYANTRWAQQ